jgi:hypothetical protein
VTASHCSEYPDPPLTANFYCGGLLDSIIQSVIKPFRSEMLERAPDFQSYLWLFRYGRCGEHLKLRVHAPPEEIPWMKESLGAAADRFFTRLPESLAPAGTGRRDVPPIDQEDAALDDYPDRSLLWTHYERSEVSLGARPRILDDTYTVLFTRCLGMACDFLLSQVVVDVPLEAGFPHQFRQSTLLKLVLSALPGFTAAERASYLAYHRDWLVRGLLAQRRPAWRGESDILQRLEEQVERLGGGIEILGELARSRWEEGARETIPELERWQEAVAHLARHIADLPEEPEGSLDPFEDNPTFPSVFKVLHGVANQLGLRKLDEAFAYHLLLRASGGVGTWGFRRVPFVSSPSRGQAIGE